MGDGARYCLSVVFFSWRAHAVLESSELFLKPLILTLRYERGPLCRCCGIRIGQLHFEQPTRFVSRNQFCIVLWSLAHGCQHLHFSPLPAKGDTQGAVWSSLFRPPCPLFLDSTHMGSELSCGSCGRHLLRCLQEASSASPWPQAMACRLGLWLVLSCPVILVAPSHPFSLLAF